MSTINDLMYQDLLAKLGESPPITLNDLTYEWLGTQGYTGTLMDRWNQLFTAAGLSGSFNDMYFDWLGLQGCLQDTLNDRLLCFWSGGSGPTLPAFYALTPDPTTKQLLGVRTGTGGLTTTHTATLYAQDQDGIYQPYSANKPVWVGGRYVDEDNVFADVTPGGADIVPQPYLQYYPAAENSLLWSRDLTNVVWSTLAGFNSSYDQVGLTGEPNTATLAIDTVTNNLSLVEQGVTVPADTAIHTAVYYVFKDTDQTRFPDLQLRFGSRSGNGAAVSLNTQTGASVLRVSTGIGAAHEVVDAGLWWKVIVTSQNNSQTSAHAVVYPAISDVIGTTNIATTGSIIVGNCELHLNKTISDVREVSPIFSTTASVAVDRTNYPYDALNSSDGTSAWYCEVTSEGAQDVIDGFLSVTGVNWQLSDGTTTVTRPWTESAAHQVGVAYGDGQMSINVDGTWSADVAYDGTMLQGALDLFRTGTFGGKMRELQRFDADTYAAARAIITGLMP